MRDITLKITGKQCYGNHEEEQMEFVTDGKLYVRGDAVYVVYDESDVSGMAGCKTTLKVSGGSAVPGCRRNFILKKAKGSAAPTIPLTAGWEWKC